MGGVEVCPRKKCIDKYSQIKQAQARGKQWHVKKVKQCTFNCRSKVWKILQPQLWASLTSTKAHITCLNQIQQDFDL
jgi:hypothetical protein